MSSSLAAEPEVNQQLAADHGLKPDEYQRILELLGRTPTFTELGIFSAMWNEHCSYKSSKIHLRTLPTEGPQVICGPGENAGIVDIGDGQALVFKMESHNHPSYIEPYQGAATGVGGILRDVFTMGARPIAAMNALSFGDPQHPKTRSLVSGVVAGIGGYGNCFGVPTVGTPKQLPYPPMPATTPDTSDRVFGCSGSPKLSAFIAAMGRAPMVKTSRRMPPTPVAAPW